MGEGGWVGFVEVAVRYWLSCRLASRLGGRRAAAVDVRATPQPGGFGLSAL